MSEGKKISVMLPKSWKKSFNNGNVIPAKLKGCDKCSGKTLCVACNNEINENEEFEASLNLLKREAPDEFGYMLPYFTE